MIEKWISLSGIVECGEFYEISNLGNLRSVDRTVISKNGVVKNFIGKIRATKKNNREYIISSIFQDGKEKTVLMHRLVALAFIPNVDNLPEVNHKDGNKNNNTIDNLEWMTSRDNQVHARNNGLSNQHGQNSINAKLQDEDAIRIREMWNAGRHTHGEISDIFKVSKSVVNRIINRKAYNHI